MANTYVNKVQLADGTSLIDISDSTVTADKILQGYTAYGADGSKLTGTATGGGGSVTQDQDGFIVLPPDGGSSPSGGGLDYEIGTFTPTEDTHSYDISFTKTHSGMPFYALVMLASGEYDATLNARAVTSYVNWQTLFGITLYDSSSTQYYGYAYYRYRGTNTSGMGSGNTTVNYPDDNTGSSSGTYPRYWVSETGIKAQAGNNYYWYAGKTYKWIAVWAPTT